MRTSIRLFVFSILLAGSVASAADRVRRAELGDLRLRVGAAGTRRGEDPSFLVLVGKAVDEAIAEHLGDSEPGAAELDPMIQAFVQRSKDPAAPNIPAKIPGMVLNAVRAANVESGQASSSVRESGLRLRDLQEALSRLFSTPAEVRKASLTELEAIARTFGEEAGRSVVELEAAKSRLERANLVRPPAARREAPEPGSEAMPTEIERRFLVIGDDWRRDAKGVRYTQGYLAYRGHANVRVRVEGDEAILTVKGKKVGNTTPEINLPIPMSEARNLFLLTDRKPVEKIRYKVPYGGHVWEVDEFLGANEGLFIAEITLKREDERFELPAWVGFEVTGEPGYSNVALYLEPYSTWASPDAPPAGGDEASFEARLTAKLASIDPAELHRHALARWNREYKPEYLLSVLGKLGQGKIGELPEDYHPNLKEMRRSASRLVGVFEMFDARRRGPGMFGSFVSQLGQLNDALDDGTMDVAQSRAASLAAWLDGKSFDEELKDFEPSERGAVIGRMDRYADRIRSAYKQSKVSSHEYHSARQDFKNFMFLFRLLSDFPHPDPMMQAAHKAAYQLSGALGKVRDDLRRAGKEGSSVSAPADLRNAVLKFLDAFQGKRR